MNVTVDLFDSDGSFLGEGKEIFDGDGNLIGHFLESAKSGVSNAFEGSWLWGVVFLLFIAPGWTLLGVVLYLLFKLIKLLFWLAITVLKFVLRCVWWLLRLPFYLLFRWGYPEF